MGIFSSIKKAIWGDDKEENKSEVGKATDAMTAAVKKAKTDAARKSAATPVTQDQLEARIAAKPGADKLNWRTSIADLMRVLDLDPSYENRKELAHDVGIDDYSGTAEQNIHLHKIVMQKLAFAGGNVPDDLKD